MIILEKLERIQSALSVLRLTILLLSAGLLVFTLFNTNHDLLVAMIINLIAVLLFIQRHLAPNTYRLFILILMIDCIYSGGHFLQIIFSRQALSFAFILVNLYTIAVIILFITILWRHYQLTLVTQQIDFSQ